ncbi:MAG: hypothetical protein QOF24_1421 [Verrucomicrobiota bacterium]|jgi:hypothetical protein
MLTEDSQQPDGDSASPFGLPDGARVNIGAGNYGFIEFNNASRWRALATQPGDLRARIFFGRKGSGKTIYLRRMEAHASAQPDLHSVKPDYNPLPTNLVVRFGQNFTAYTVTEGWTRLWRIAILRSVAAQILFDPSLSTRFSKNELESLNHFSICTGVPPLQAALTIFDNVKVLIAACTSRNGTDRVLEDAAWLHLDTVLKTLVHKCPPLCFYIDAIDDEFSHAPMYWMHCQRGLFTQIMWLLRDAVYGSRLHVFACLRDLVLVRVLAGEHAMRFIESEYIRPLFWDFEAASRFLNKKVEALSKRYYVQYDRDGTLLERWLGFSEITNEARNTVEPVDQYLLRHTRLLPRDVIILGNALCESIARGALNAADSNREKHFRQVVSQWARSFGKEQLVICTNQISSDQMPAEAGAKKYSDVYTSIAEYRDGILEQLGALIEGLRTDRFKAAAISRRRKKIDREFESADPFQALWQNGLLGYVEKRAGGDRFIFYGDHQLQSFKLPRAAEYVFHPCILDTLNIKSVGSQPVIPYYKE